VEISTRLDQVVSVLNGAIVAFEPRLKMNHTLVVHVEVPACSDGVASPQPPSSPSTEIDAAARPDCRQSSLRGNELPAQIKGFRASRVAHAASLHLFLFVLASLSRRS
jgi:hypothetical protein